VPRARKRTTGSDCPRFGSKRSGVRNNSDCGSTFAADACAPLDSASVSVQPIIQRIEHRTVRRRASDDSSECLNMASSVWKMTGAAAPCQVHTQSVAKLSDDLSKDEKNRPRSAGSGQFWASSEDDD
jgi:hypothetical protein